MKKMSNILENAKVQVIKESYLYLLTPTLFYRVTKYNPHFNELKKLDGQTIKSIELSQKPIEYESSDDQTKDGRVIENNTKIIISKNSNNQVEEATTMSADMMTGFGPAPGGGFNMPLEAAKHIMKSKKKKNKDSFMGKFIDLNLKKNEKSIYFL